VGSRAGLDGRKILLPTGIQFPDRPARSQSLYRLSYPAHKYIHMYLHIYIHTYMLAHIYYKTKISSSVCHPLLRNILIVASHFSVKIFKYDRIDNMGVSV